MGRVSGHGSRAPLGWTRDTTSLAHVFVPLAGLSKLVGQPTYSQTEQSRRAACTHPVSGATISTSRARQNSLGGSFGIPRLRREVPVKVLRVGRTSSRQLQTPLVLVVSVACCAVGCTSNDSDAGDSPASGGDGGSALAGSGGVLGEGGMRSMGGAAARGGQAGDEMAGDDGSTDGGGGGGGLGGQSGDLPGPLDYSDMDTWLCHPNKADDKCLALDLSATEARPDGTFVAVDHDELEDPEFDCFYVYPTVDLRRESGNTTDFSDTGEIEGVLSRQGAWFRSVCRVFAPLYRQMTIGTYSNGDFAASAEFSLAFGDVEAAFEDYLQTDNDGRGIVLIGHSQGSHILTRLLVEKFDNDRTLRDQLISALLVGPGGRVSVPQNEVVGGTFQNIPLCEAKDQTQCVIAFDSAAAGLSPTRDTNRACTSPAQLNSGSSVVGNTLWPTSSTTFAFLDLPFPDEVTQSAWAFYPELYSAQCGSDGFLELSLLEEDPRAPLGDPDVVQTLEGQELSASGLALHRYDFLYAMGDLLDIAAAQGASY